MIGPSGSTAFGRRMTTSTCCTSGRRWGGVLSSRTTGPTLRAWRFSAHTCGNDSTRGPRRARTLLRLDGDTYTIVGVLPPDIVFPERVDLWVPLALEPASGGGWYLRGMGRLKAGVLPAGAQADLERIHRGLIDVRPVNKTTTPRVTPLRARVHGGAPARHLSAAARGRPGPVAGVLQHHGNDAGPGHDAQPGTGRPHLARGSPLAHHPAGADGDPAAVHRSARSSALSWGGSAWVCSCGVWPTTWLPG